MFVPSSTVIIGFAVTNPADGWNTIGSFFSFLFVSTAACLVPVILGTTALLGDTKQNEKALLAIMAPLMILFAFVVSFGGLAEWGT